MQERNDTLRSASARSSNGTQPAAADSSAEIEAVLLRDPSVSDCVVLLRHNETGAEERVAYVVSTGLASADRLRERLIEALPDRELPSAFVQLPSLPLTLGGTVDVEALALLEVADRALARRWEERVKAVPGVEQAAVVVEEIPGRTPLVHLSDLLLGWKAGQRDDDSAPSAFAASGAVAPRPMAFADGGPLTLPEGAPTTFTEALFRTARVFPDKGIRYIGEDGGVTFHGYAALLEDARRLLTGLRESGLAPGDRVVLQQATLKDHFTTFWACVLGGIIPVTVAIAPSYAVAGGVTGKLYNTWELLEHPVILASKSLVAPLAGLAKLYPMEGMKVVATDDFKACAPAETVHPARPDDLIFFQLSSGSTGIPKCIQERHGSIVRHVHAAAQFNGYTSDDVSLNWLPVDHVVPILTWHLRDVYLGIDQVELKPDLILENPLLWLDLIERYRVTQTWSPNFGFKLITDGLSSAPNRSWDLSSIKYFMNAGEQVTLSVVRDFLRMLAPFGVGPLAMQPAFGMAEVCTCMTYANDFSLEKGVHRVLKSSLGGDLELTEGEDLATVTTFVDLGPPVPGVQIRITDGQNRPVREGVIGRFQIKGGVVTPGYLNNEQANAEAFVGDGWFNSGDLGFILHGRLTLTGREKEIIIIRGANFYCYEIEDTVNTVPGVEPTFAAAAAVEDPASGSEGLAVFFVPKEFAIEERFDIAQAVRTEVTARLGVSPSFVVPMPRHEFPKTTSGKIQRVALKKGLLAGQFNDTLKAMDLHQGNANTLPDWFFRRAWRRKEVSHPAPGTAELPGGRTLIFADQHGLGARLFDELVQLGRPVVLVEEGARFERLSATHYRLDLRDPESYRALLVAAKDDGPVEQLLHLFTHDKTPGNAGGAEIFDRSQERGAQSLLFLVQALAFVHDGEHPVSLLVVSTHAQTVAEGDRLALEKTPLLGLLRTLPQELGWLSARHLDLASLDVSDGAVAVLRELRAPLRDPEVAIREGVRWVPRLARAELAAKEAHPARLVQGGVYLLAGEIAGNGAEIARQLVLQHGARLLIIEERPLPERAAWESHVGKGDALSRRVEAHLALERLGGEIVRETMPLDDDRQLRVAVTRARDRWGREVDGIIQLPDEIPSALLIEETAEGLSAALRRSAHRALALSSLLMGRPDRLYVCFSSASGIFGSATMGALNSAAAFFDAFAQHLRQSDGIHALCLGWTLWDGWESSRSEHIRELARAQGYLPIRAAEGWSTLLAALQRDETQLYVGLDGENRRIRGQIEGEHRPVSALRAYYSGPDRKAPLGALRALSVEDRFRQASHADFVYLDKMPLLPSGEVDLTALAQSRMRGLPETDLQREIASIWQEVLGLPRVGIHDSFFELGGHSLLATQIVSRLRRAFGVELSLSHLFSGPTIAELSRTIEAQQLEQASADDLLGLLSELEGLSDHEVKAELGGEGA
jgi:acyl-CoA synthetase (AMP-forming)/AMP-acid ligase II/acyl carrier protein